jgi:predicted MFS family arabinose efflux permease
LKANDRNRPPWILPAIVISQVLVTSTWFAVNAVAQDISLLWPQGDSVGQVTLMVQLGFIAGTLVMATTGLSDAMSGRRLFLISALCAAVTNGGILFAPGNYWYVLVCRFLTGLALAGVYPVGMKIAAGWYAAGLGRALGYLVGALVLGTSLTHLARAVQFDSHWHHAIVVSSLAAVVGGWLMSLVPDGPHLQRDRGQRLRLQALSQAMAEPDFRRAALAYFGHMWELYTFWAFMPRWIQTLQLSPATTSFYCFAVIAVGMIGCIAGGLAAERYGSRRVARTYLAISAGCCLLSPLVYGSQPWLLMVFLLVWGVAVVGDSPQLSSLNALAAPREMVGSALTASTCIGFSITVVSLIVMDALSATIDPRYLFVPLVLGPLIGVWCLRRRALTSSESKCQ